MNEAKKKYLIGGAVLALLAVCIIGFTLFQSMKESPQIALESYIASLQKKDYGAMYDNVTTSLKKDDFVKRVKNIYDGIEMKNLKMNVKDSESKDNGTSITYEVEMDSIAGKIHFQNKVLIVRLDENYKMRWDSRQIFPKLNDEDRVRVNPISAQRGSILDRNGNALAKQGLVFNVGLVAGSMGDEAASIKQMAEALNISEESVKKSLSASWVKEGLFVPVKSISEKEKYERAETLNKIDGASIQRDIARLYPYGEMTAHITGYVQSISAEELKRHKDEGYDGTSVIGKSGLEQVYEKKLKAKDGYEILITDKDGESPITMANKKPENGQDIATTIDIKAQKIVYDELKNDAGAGVMLNSHTGEVLAMVSTPSYDPNAFVLGISSEQWNKYNNADTTPLLNRVTSTFAPGSTFKAVTGAVGLDSKTINASSAYEKRDKWQKDKSWGNNYVTTTRSYSEPSNLKNAYKYSDNIFFAQLADKIGASTYRKYLDEIGFNKSMNFPLSVVKSTYGKLDSDQKLAAAGYGQGELLTSPLHLSALYSAYTNDGTILQPYLIYDSGKTEILKKQAYTKESADIVFADLQNAMHSYGANPTNAAGKSGTAQVKNGAEEIGWLCAVNDKISITVMIDDTKNVGESLYVIPKAQSILRSYR